MKKQDLFLKQILQIKIKKNPFKNLSKEIKKQNPKDLLKLTRAYNHFMNLYNLAESVDASRTLDQYENSSIIKKIKIYLLKKYLKVFLKIKIFLINKFMI